jgi:hypothetical protein
MADIATLDRVFPGARFVMTHRALLSSVTSSAALIVGLSSALTSKPDPLYEGRRQMNFYDTSLRRLLAFRDSGNEHRFFDIQFADFQSNALRTIRGLYRWLGEEFSIEAEARMKTWWSENRMQREPSRYRPEYFGIDPAELKERFSFYNERFLALQ